MTDSHPQIWLARRAPGCTLAAGIEAEEGIAAASGAASDRKKPVYFEWAKKSWETEETFKLPDGTYWPYVSVCDATPSPPAS